MKLSLDELKKMGMWADGEFVACPRCESEFVDSIDSDYTDDEFLEIWHCSFCNLKWTAYFKLDHMVTYDD